MQLIVKDSITSEVLDKVNIQISEENHMQYFFRETDSAGVVFFPCPIKKSDMLYISMDYWSVRKSTYVNKEIAVNPGDFKNNSLTVSLYLEKIPRRKLLRWLREVE